MGPGWGQEPSFRPAHSWITRTQVMSPGRQGWALGGYTAPALLAPGRAAGLSQPAARPSAPPTPSHAHTAAPGASAHPGGFCPPPLWVCSCLAQGSLQPTDESPKLGPRPVPLLTHFRQTRLLPASCWLGLAPWCPAGGGHRVNVLGGLEGRCRPGPRTFCAWEGRGLPGRGLCGAHFLPWCSPTPSSPAPPDPPCTPSIHPFPRPGSRGPVPGHEPASCRDQVSEPRPWHVRPALADGAPPCVHTLAAPSQPGERARARSG